MLRMMVRALSSAVVTTAGIVFILTSHGASAQRLASDSAKKKSAPVEVVKAPTGMVLVKAGEFSPATTPAEAQKVIVERRMDKRQKERFQRFVAAELVAEKRRKVEVPAYFLDLVECTNRQYFHFMLTTGGAPPNLPKDHPARWREGRLPGATQKLFLDEVKNFQNLVAKLKTGAKAANASRPVGRVWALLDRKLQEKLKKAKPKKELDAELPEAIVQALNAVIMRRDFYDAKFFRGVVIRGHLGRETLALQNKGRDKLTESDLTRLNRIYLDETLKGCIERGQPREMMLFPVTGLTFFQAKGCSEWMGKRLPSEMEWEKGARGVMDSRWYPWGSAFGEAEINFCNWALFWASRFNKDMRPEGLCAVGSFPKGTTPYGMFDMVGNAIEMVDNTWAPHKNAVRGKGVVFDPPESESCCVIKGGGYGEMFQEHLRIPFRYPWKKSESSDAIGFRCAKDTRLGKTALNRIAGDLFQGMWDSRIIKLDTENGLAAMEKVRYDEMFPDQAIITEYSWIGFLNIRDHLYDSAKALTSASDKVRRKNQGHIFLGVFHTDIALEKPNLRPGNYAIVFQKGFKVLDSKEKKKTAKKKNGATEKKPNDKKSKKKKKKKPKKKKRDKKKDRGKGKKKPPAKKGDDKKEPKAEPKAKPATPASIPRFAPVARILFLDASGKPVGAIEKPVIRTLKKEDRAALTITPAEKADPKKAAAKKEAKELQPALLTLHLAMLKKYEKRKFLVIDIPIQPKVGKELEDFNE